MLENWLIMSYTNNPVITTITAPTGTSLLTLQVQPAHRQAASSNDHRIHVAAYISQSPDIV